MLYLYWVNHIGALMKTVLSLLFVLSFTLYGAMELQPDSISYQLLSDTSAPAFLPADSFELPLDIQKGEYRAVLQFKFAKSDSLTHLLIRPNDHPFVIKESSTQFFQRGFIDGTGTVATYSPSLVHLPLVDSDTIRLLVELYPNGDQSSLINITATDYAEGSRSFFWNNFFNSTFLTAVVFSSFIICIITFLIWITSGCKNKKFVYFCLATISIGLGHINVMFCYPGADQLLLWKIARIAYIFAPIFLLYFAVSMLHNPKRIATLPKLFFIFAVIFSIGILPQTTKYGIEQIFLFAANITGMPALFCMLIVSLYAMKKEKNRSAVIPVVGVIAIFFAAIHDFYFLMTDQVPFSWMIAYTYLILEISIVILLSKEVGALYKQNLTSSNELLLRNSELQKERDISERVRKSKDLFLKNMAHEFKTPLQGIVTTTELLNNQCTTAEEIETIINALTIQMQLHRLSIQNVLDVSLLEDSDIDNIEKTFEVTEFFDTIKQLFNSQEQTANKALDLSFAKGTPQYLSGNEEQISRILLSLLSNTCVGHNHCTVRVNTSWDPVGYLIFAFNSHRECLNPLLLEYIDNPEKATVDSVDNISLLVAMKLVERIEGSLEMNDSGDEILLSVPCKEVMNTFRFPTPSREKILLAEDNPVNRMVISKLLEKMGYIVITADNGAEAVKLVEQESPKLVLMDVQMPVMDGIEATRVIRRSERNRDLVIVALTANATKKDCLDVGMNGFLRKPIAGKELQRVIEQHFAR